MFVRIIWNLALFIQLEKGEKVRETTLLAANIGKRQKTVNLNSNSLLAAAQRVV